MTPEDFIAEAKRRGKSKEETQRRYAELKASGAFDAPEQDAPEPEQGALDTARGAIGTVLKGTLAEWGDEIVGGGRALADYGIAKALGEEDGDQTLRERYEMYRDDERDVQQQFAKENPKTATGLSLTGAVTSPLNFVGPGLQAAKAAGAAKAAAQLGARGSAEGALTGAGAADEAEDMAFRAQRGAGVGGATSALIGGLGRGLSSRKVADELGSGEDFVPIHMTSDDNIYTDVARQGLGRVAGAASKLRNQEKRFLEHADEGLEAAETLAKTVKKAKGPIEDMDLDFARKQAQEAISQAALEGKGGQGLWKATEAANFDPRKMAQRLDKYWNGDRAFSEVKGMKFDADDELLSILKNHFPEDDIAETARGQVTGKRMMDLRNDFARIANKGGPSMKGKEAKAYKKEIDKWMKKQMGGEDSVDAQRFQDELDSYAEYMAFDKGLPPTNTKRKYMTEKVASGRGKAGKRGSDVAQSRAEKVELQKQAARDKAEAGLKQAKEQSRELHRRSAPRGSGLSELFTTQTLGGALDLGVRFATLPMGLGAGQLLASQPGQRFIAGQTGIQKALQDDETAKLLAQIMRQTISRQAAGE